MDFIFNDATVSLKFSVKVLHAMDRGLVTLDSGSFFQSFLLVVYIGILCLMISIIALLFVMLFLILLTQFQEVRTIDFSGLTFPLLSSKLRYECTLKAWPDGQKREC